MHRKICSAVRLLLLMVCASSGSLAATIDYSVHLNSHFFGNLRQQDVPEFENCACGPTAAINSFVWLQNIAPEVYGEKLVPPGQAPMDFNKDGVLDQYDDMAASALVLARPRYMNLFPFATLQDFFYGKRTYIEDRVAGKTDYQAMYDKSFAEVDPAAAGNFEHPRTPEVILQPPTPQFISSNLKEMEDIELFVYRNGKGHYVTVTGIDWVDDGNGMIDDNERARIIFLDPSNRLGEGAALKDFPLFQRAIGGRMYIRNPTSGNAYDVYFAVKESPKEVPDSGSTFGLLALSAVGLAAFSVCRRGCSRF
jgi:hypothetical protein